MAKGALWVGSQHRIVAAQIPLNKFNSKIEVNPNKVCLYDPKCKIWGFFPDLFDDRDNEFTIVFETFRDHILDFNKISALEFDPNNFKPVVK